MVKKHRQDPEELKDGDEVLYVAHLDGWHEDGGAYFLFQLVEDGPPPVPGSLSRRQRAGDIVDGDMGTVESYVEGILKTSKGFTLRVLCPRAPWPAVVREEESDLVLDVKHPNRIVTLHLPLSTLTHDPSGKTPHSWHRAGEAE